MADTKLSALTELAATPASDDEIYIRDVSEAEAAESKRITIANLMAAGSGVPSGLIVMWHGLISNIPAGYVICDGNNSTPNLLAKFVQGVATAETDPGATGGEASHTLTMSELPNGGVGGVLEWTGSGGNYDVGGGGMMKIGGGDQAHENRPPFFDVAFIMKT